MLYTVLMRPSGTTARRRPRWVLPVVLFLGSCALAALLLLVIYPRVGAWMIRGKVGDKLATKLGRDIRFGAIDVKLGHATLHDLEIRGPNDGDTPLVHIDRLDIEFDTLRSLVGPVEAGRRGDRRDRGRPSAATAPAQTTSAT